MLLPKKWATWIRARVRSLFQAPISWSNILIRHDTIINIRFYRAQKQFGTARNLIQSHSLALILQPTMYLQKTVVKRTRNLSYQRKRISLGTTLYTSMTSKLPTDFFYKLKTVGQSECKEIAFLVNVHVVSVLAGCTRTKQIWKYHTGTWDCVPRSPAIDCPSGRSNDATRSSGATALCKRLLSSC